MIKVRAVNLTSEDTSLILTLNACTTLHTSRLFRDNNVGVYKTKKTALLPQEHGGIHLLKIQVKFDHFNMLIKNVIPELTLI